MPVTCRTWVTAFAGAGDSEACPAIVRVIVTGDQRVEPGGVHEADTRQVTHHVIILDQQAQVGCQLGSAG